MHQKQNALIYMLKENEKALVLVDPRVEGVDVPDECRDSLPLGLDLGMHLPIPVQDLTLTGEGFSATLSFNRQPHFVSIPWDAVFGIVGDDNAGPLWPDFMPEEIAGEFPLDMQPADDEEPEEDQVRKLAFGVVDGDGEGPSEETPREKPSLTLVK